MYSFEENEQKKFFWLVAVKADNTCIHNKSLQTFSQDYDLVSHTSDVMCANFIHKPLNL